jgi:hypothetical protein
MLFGWLNDLLARPKTIRPRKPSAPGAAYDNSLREDRLVLKRKFAARAAESRLKAIKLGMTDYRWLNSGGACCDIAKRNDGRIFSYLKPPPEGHVGEGDCGADWCRCVAKSIAQEP